MRMHSSTKVLSLRFASPWRATPASEILLACTGLSLRPSISSPTLPVCCAAAPREPCVRISPPPGALSAESPARPGLCFAGLALGWPPPPARSAARPGQHGALAVPHQAGPDVPPRDPIAAVPASPGPGWPSSWQARTPPSAPDSPARLGRAGAS
jgi:hypothetical protein